MKLTFNLLCKGSIQFPKITKSYFLLLSTCSILINLRMFPNTDGCQVIDSLRCDFGCRVNS